MLDIMELLKAGDTPVVLIALAVVYNLIRHGLNRYFDLKREREERADNERLIELASKLSAALIEIQYLKLEIDELKKGH